MRKIYSLAMLICLLIVVGSLPVSADCVSCGPGGECFTAAAGFSANCECRIKSVGGATVCTPKGVCSADDSNSCDNQPQPTLVPGGRISTKFLKGLAAKNPLLAGAVWGALSEKDSPSGEILYSQLVQGEYSGTMGKRRKELHLSNPGAIAGRGRSLACRSCGRDRDRQR